MFFKENWKKLTSDKWIIQTITGYKLDLDSIPNQTSIPKPLSFSDSDQKLINAEIERFLEANIIEKIFSEDENEFISNIFFRPKKDGRIRIILNLKTFNESHMDKCHFILESLQSAISV